MHHFLLFILLSIPEVPAQESRIPIEDPIFKVINSTTIQVTIVIPDAQKDFKHIELCQNTSKVGSALRISREEGIVIQTSLNPCQDHRELYLSLHPDRREAKPLETERFDYTVTEDCIGGVITDDQSLYYSLGVGVPLVLLILCGVVVLNIRLCECMRRRESHSADRLGVGNTEFDIYYTTETDYYTEEEVYCDTD